MKRLALAACLALLGCSSNTTTVYNYGSPDGAVDSGEDADTTADVVGVRLDSGSDAADVASEDSAPTTCVDFEPGRNSSDCYPFGMMTNDPCLAGCFVQSRNRYGYVCKIGTAPIALGCKFMRRYQSDGLDRFCCSMADCMRAPTLDSACASATPHAYSCPIDPTTGAVAVQPGAAGCVNNGTGPNGSTSCCK